MITRLERKPISMLGICSNNELQEYINKWKQKKVDLKMLISLDLSSIIILKLRSYKNSKNI